MQRALSVSVSGPCTQKLVGGEALLGFSLGDHGSQVQGIRASVEESRVSLRERFLTPSVGQDLITSVS